jgi:hypothetical protein
MLWFFQASCKSAKKLIWVYVREKIVSAKEGIVRW